ncbi:hypothetical protein PoB_000670500 [Plakobranchus ocellatus]|uniref:OTU domain-containing protein n=1 Tax=Plakobranchus ocellatus TaxID=259542 RepID=A0AAV3YCG0_9GAST|nr:hypothetical protein PoB_000670500 [Plakobranchus ocellatus]
MRPKRATQMKKNVGLCPCIFCREICSEESSSAECSSCKGWIHLLKKASFSPNQVRAEQLMLKTYNIDLPKSVPMSSSASRVDDISGSILKRYHPVILESHVPIEVCCDGNCLFRAVSKGLRNTEEHYMQIRLLTLLELILNRIHYDYEHEAFVDHFNDDRLLFDRFDTVLKDIATEFSYCGMVALSGISAALSVPIQSYCPPTQGAYFLSEPLARVVRGRGVSQRKNPAFILMWTCSFIPLTTNAFTPNHFVVLHNNLKSPVVDLTFVFADDNHDDDSASATAAVACVGNDDEDDDTAAVADISDNGTVDYDEDEADDYDDDAIDKDGHFVSTEPDILPGGKSLPLGRFLETEKVIEILQRTSVNDTHSEVPRGKKDDVYSVVQNENNKDRRT